MLEVFVQNINLAVKEGNFLYNYDLLVKIREFKHRIQELDLSPEEKAKMLEDYWNFITQAPLIESDSEY